ncbi:spore coat protein U domain-containing protein [Cronobacter dublinensis]|nr:spore coat protein U domain-containing protein [Cronobacter dublinensis]EKF2291321.1 spore coat protein U domain-containing protein [Cronobacter dublinensis]EKF2295336.1 spore coat protein U domain-containing protein [Cronobacter dublinensis]EKK5267720.1 spore coat protein U domain-containing protein [Cronobacter dublinensis]EKM0136153.1 spore coat protein U domain-containing protein [Cronobacter dublinensis]
MMRLLLLMILLFSSLPALAACRVSGTNAAYGSQTSFVINSTVQTTTATLTVDCDTAFNVLNNDFVTLTLTGATTSADTRPTLGRSGDATDRIPLQVCAQSGCSSGSELTLNGSYRWTGQALLNLLTSKRYTFPIYIRTLQGQNVAAGAYQVTLNFSVSYSICAVGVAVCLNPQTGTTTFTSLVTLTVTNDCSTISAPNLNFASAPLVKDFAPVSQTIAITCTKGSLYTVGINNGNNAVGSVRNMANGANRLSYEIYKGSTANRWGVSGTERWASDSATQVSTDGLLRSYQYTARILATQNTPPAGSYTDTLVVDVAF